VNVTISDIDPDLGGTTLSRETIATSCPGPWTLGNTIAGSLVLDAYVDTVDDGVTIDVSVSQADVQLTYLAGNDGHIPTAITGGTYGISGSELAVPPATIPPRSRVTLDTVTQTVDVSALDGAIVTIGLSLQGTSANEFAIACSDEENLVFQL
jgi:hypothetical protein